MTRVDTALVVGCGSIGTRHASNLQSLGIDVVGYDSDPDRREAIAAELDVETTDGLAAALALEPDVAIVAVPNSAHVNVAYELATAGVNLFVEKPLSDTEDGVSELVAIADERGLTTMVGCNMRFHPLLQRLKTLLDQEAIGELVTARIEAGSYLPSWHPDEDYRESYSARRDLGGGVIFDFIHEINYARWFFGDAAEVTAMTREATTLDIETAETAAIVVRFEGGLVVQILLDYVQRPYRRSCRVIGSDGTLAWNWRDKRVSRYDPDAGSWQYTDLPDEWANNTMYVSELEHFLAAVRNDEQTICSLRDGWRDLRVALGARASAENGVHERIDGPGI
jgi:predicted dehydrogenase